MVERAPAVPCVESSVMLVSASCSHVDPVGRKTPDDAFVAVRDTDPVWSQVASRARRTASPNTVPRSPVLWARTHKTDVQRFLCSRGTHTHARTTGHGVPLLCESPWPTMVRLAGPLCSHRPPNERNTPGTFRSVAERDFRFQSVVPFPDLFWGG
jgi:hypothetical protein